MVDDEDDLILITSDGVVIRMAVEEISTFSRPAKGVRVMRVNDGEKIVTLARTEKAEEACEEEESDSPDAQTES